MAQQIAAKCREIRKFLCCISNDFHNMKQAIEKDQYDKFILFFEQGKVKPQDYDDDTGNNPLHLTVKAGRHQMVEYVLNFVRGVEREDKNFDGDTALMLAVLYSDLKMVRLLVEQGKVDLNSKEGEGFTPFMAACANGKIEIVEYFLSDPKCNVSAKNLQGQTAIHRASFYGEVQVIRLLREHTKLMLNSRDTRGNTCLHFAAMRLNMTCFRYILKKYASSLLVCQQYLIRLGDQGESEMKKRNQEGQTPVMLLIKAFNMIKKDDRTISEQEVLNYIQDKNKPPANLYESIKEQKPSIFPKIENPKDMLIRSGNQPMKIATIAEQQDDGNISKNNNSNNNNPNSATTPNNPVNKQSVELEQITKQPETNNDIQQVVNNNSNNNIVDPKSMEAVVPGEQQVGATIKELNFSSSEENNLLKRRPNSQKINLKNIASQLRSKVA